MGSSGSPNRWPAGWAPAGYEGTVGEETRYGADAAAEELRAQRDQRRARMFQGDDGMWRLDARFDPITGKRLHQIYESALRAVRNRPGSAADSHAQRAAGGFDRVAVAATVPDERLTLLAERSARQTP